MPILKKVCAISATACLKTCLIGCPNRSSSRKYAKQPSPSFVPALYPVCLCLFFLLNPPKRFLTKFAAVKSAMLTFVTLALRIHPFAATPFCLAPQLANLPAFGFSKVVFYDNPPCSGVYTAVSRRMSSASMLRMPCTNSDFGRVALHFACDRDFMVCSYKLVQSILAASPCSQGELCGKMSNKLNVPVYCALFAVRVFIELGFIEFTPGGALRNSSEIRPAPLCASTYIPLSNVCARAISRTRSRMIPMNKFSVLCRYRLTRFIRQKFQYFSITANKHSRCISRAGMKRKEQI